MNKGGATNVVALRELSVGLTTAETFLVECAADEILHLRTALQVIAGGDGDAQMIAKQSLGPLRCSECGNLVVIGTNDPPDETPEDGYSVDGVDGLCWDCLQKAI